MRQTDINRLSRIYLLLRETYPTVLEGLEYEFPNQAIVAANLLQATKNDEFTCRITSDSNSQFNFCLDLVTRSGESKGNWIWVKKVQISSGDHLLVSITMNKRVIDIPYCKNNVSAFSLLKNFYPEFIATLNAELNI